MLRFSWLVMTSPKTTTLSLRQRFGLTAERLAARLVLDVSGVPLVPFSPGGQGAPWDQRVLGAHSAWTSRGSSSPWSPFKAADACLDGRGPCEEKGQVQE